MAVTDEILTLESKVSLGRGRKRNMSDLIEDKQNIIELIKKGYRIGDDVLKAVGIKKTVRDVKVYNEIVKHEKSDKTYEKDTESVRQIIKQLHTITTQNFEDNDQTEENGNTEEDEYDM